MDSALNVSMCVVEFDDFYQLMFLLFAVAVDIVLYKSRR